jgi:pilus assembly protein CpaB
MGRNTVKIHLPESSREFLRKHRSILLPSTAALLGTILIWHGIRSHKERLGLNLRPTSVLVSSKALGEGHRLRSDDFLLREVPQKYIPVGTVLSSDLQSVIGRPILRPMAEGEMFLWPSIDTGLGPAGPARRISPGYRAISIPVDPVTSVGHAVQADDHVDLILTASLAGIDGPRTLTLLQNVAVFDVGVEAGDEAGGSVITLMVLPKEVPLITHAQQSGKVTLALRSPGDHKTPGDLPLVSAPHLVESGFRNSMQEERNRTVEIIRGGSLGLDPSLP